MESVTLRTSTIVVATRKRTQIFHSLDAMPRTLQKQVVEMTTGPNARTLIIANRNGHERLLRALNTLNQASQPKSTSAVAPIHTWRSAKYFWVEATVIGLLGLACWSFFFWK